MPLDLLPEAMRRVRECARSNGKKIYVNPYTQVPFPTWMPSTTNSNQHLKPSKSTQHFTAYEATFDLLVAINRSHIDTPLKLQFVGLQPRLGDFKLQVDQPWRFGLRDRPLIIQHKLDKRERSYRTEHSKVSIGRGQGSKRRFYFTAFDRSVLLLATISRALLISSRFDYLFYHFDYKYGPEGTPYAEFYFIPEKVIPDEFYQSQEIEVTFNRQEFLPYLILMDNDGHGLWVQRMWEIIQQNPEPRRNSSRPIRSTSISDLSADLEPEKSLEVAEDESEEGEDPHARHQYAMVTAHRHRQFFDTITKQCAIRYANNLDLL